MQNEKTSKKVASSAGGTMQRVGVLKLAANAPLYAVCGNRLEIVCYAGDLKKISGSALTQTPDKNKKRK